MQVFTRQIAEEDASQVAMLCDQLGYKLTPEQVLQNIRLVKQAKDHEAFVAVQGGEVIGWIGVCQAIQIESVPYAEIRGLVVDDRFRNRGIGKLLIEKTKKWGRDHGSKKLRLRCNRVRRDTHRFYEHLNFREVKEQKVFEILIS